jgi:glycine/D-amino acid oxidase-like deaminating enzyme
MAQSVEYLVVGAGVAGLSAAAHLVLGGAMDVLVLDREQRMGFYASSNNAAIARQLTGTAAHTALTSEGRGRLDELGLMDSKGGFLLAADQNGLDALAAEAARFGIGANRAQGSPFQDCLASESLEVPSDGTIDIDGMLNWCANAIRAGGASIQLGASVEGIQMTDGGCLVETSGGTAETIKAKVIVNAAGGWAQGIGAMAKGLPIAFRPMRRHLVWSHAHYPKDRPWTWWADRPFYMRPESGGLLMSPLDEVEVAPPCLNAQPATDQGVLVGMAETLRQVAPSLSECPINRLWCGLRTFSADRKFVIGWDTVNPRLFWVTGLAGHGMTSGLAVGRMAAQLLKSGGSANELDPRRFCA